MPNDSAESTSSTGPASAERAEAITKALATAPDPTDHVAVRTFGHTLTGLGCAVLFIMPGTKVPADMRPQRRRRQNDYESAKGGGYSESAPRGGGVYQATADPAEFNRLIRLLRSPVRPRLRGEPGRRAGPLASGGGRCRHRRAGGRVRGRRRAGGHHADRPQPWQATSRRHLGAPRRRALVVRGARGRGTARRPGHVDDR